MSYVCSANIGVSQAEGWRIMSILSPCCRAGGGAHIEAQYRQYPQITKNQKFQAELLSSAMWFWILWHCWHDPDAVLVSQTSDVKVPKFTTVDQKEIF